MCSLHLASEEFTEESLLMNHGAAAGSSHVQNVGRRNMQHVEVPAPKLNPFAKEFVPITGRTPQGCSRYLNENWDVNHRLLIVLKSKRDFGAGQISNIAGLNYSHSDRPSLYGRTAKLVRRTQIAYANLENQTVEGSEEGKAESNSKDSSTVPSSGKTLSLDAPTSSPFASGKISSKIAAKAAQSGQNESTSSTMKVKNPPSDEAVSIASRNSITTAPKDATKVAAGPTLPPRPPITPVLKPSAITPKSLIENGTQGASRTGKVSPFVADRLKSQAASPPSQYNRTSSGRTMINSGKQVLEAFKQGEKEGKTTKFGQPIVPKNIFDDVRRTPEEMEADKFQFKLSPGDLILGFSFVLIIGLMLGTAFVVWKVGAIH